MEKKSSSSIGVFDSGFGGLHILKSIVKSLPQYNFIYLGDTARTPYGGRSQATIFEFSKEAVDFLWKQDCEIIIFACNTASSEALRRIQREYLPNKYPDRRVLGVIIPAVEETALKTKNKKVGVIATEATVKSEAFPDEFKKVDPEIKVFQNACPLLVPVVESGEVDSSATDIILKDYLVPLLKKDIDTLLLGCTHYGLLLDKIKEIVGSSVNIVSEADIVPKKLEDYLSRHSEIEQKLLKDGVVRFYSTDITNKFQVFGSKFFGHDIKPEKVSL